MQELLADLAAAPDIDCLEVFASICKHSHGFQRHLPTPGDVQLFQTLPASLSLSV